MALDVGVARTGVALTDPLQMIASPHAVVEEPPARRHFCDVAARR